MLYFLSKKNSNRLYKYVKDGKIKKIYGGVYSDEIDKSEEELFKENIEYILLKTYFIGDGNEYLKINENFQIEKADKNYILDGLNENTKNFYISDFSSLYGIYNNTFFIRGNSNFKKEILGIKIVSQMISKKHDGNLEKLGETYKTNLETTLLDLCSEKGSFGFDFDLKKIISEFFEKISIQKIKELGETRKTVYYKFMKIYKEIKNEKKEEKEKSKENFKIQNIKFGEQLKKIEKLLTLSKNQFSIEKLKKTNIDFSDEGSLNENMKILTINNFLFFQKFYGSQGIEFSKEEFGKIIKGKEQHEITNLITIEKLMFSKKEIFSNIENSDQFFHVLSGIYKGIEKKNIEINKEYLDECFYLKNLLKIQGKDSILFYIFVIFGDNTFTQEEKMKMFKVVFDVLVYIEYGVLIDLSSEYNKLIELQKENNGSLITYKNLISSFIF